MKEGHLATVIGNCDKPQHMFEIGTPVTIIQSTCGFTSNSYLVRYRSKHHNQYIHPEDLIPTQSLRIGRLLV